MAECWYCHWGWATQVADLYDKYTEKLQDLIIEKELDYVDLGSTNAHCVWSDENFDDSDIDSAIKYCQEEPTAVNLLAIESLQELRKIPEGIRCCEPKDYDGEHPEKYPPQIPTRKV